MTLHAFERSLRDQSHHVSAFLMLGDPTPDLCVELALAAIDGGATMLELGFPFSDPCADGPAIQRSCLRARKSGVSTGGALAILERIHLARPTVPLHLLVYGNLVHAWGYDVFCRDAVRAGASTLLVPDIPLEESVELREAAAANGVGHVSLVGPRTDLARLQELDATTTGFLYLAAYQGVTGEGASRSADATGELLRRVVGESRHPVCLGFGISTREQIDAAFAAGARIAVIGSHLARSIDDAIDDPEGIDGERIRESFCAALAPLTAISSPVDVQAQDGRGEARCS
jgi:tryptophan synthase alpha chain